MIGAIDGTFIGIRKFSKKNIKDYISCRNRCDLNIMVVCGPDHLVCYCSTQWPGSVNDSRIFRESSIRQLLETGKHLFSLALKTVM